MTESVPNLRAAAPARPLIDIVEVSARDGLQSEPTVLSVDKRVDLLTRIAAAGFSRIEAVSFVNPRRVPQMADAEAVMEGLHRRRDAGTADASWIGLVLNRRGLARARECGVDEINVVVVCTDTFGMANQGAGTDQLIDMAHELCAEASGAGMTTSITLTAAFGCPYEGEVSLDRLRYVVERLDGVAADELALADSIGVAAPLDVRERLALTREVSGSVRLRCHFHNTRNTGLANALAAAEWGVGVLDASLGGLGGCPFAPNATGNIPTEDLVYLLDRSGYTTGVDMAAMLEIPGRIEALVGHSVPGYVAKAGWFPPPAAEAGDR